MTGGTGPGCPGNYACGIFSLPTVGRDSDSDMTARGAMGGERIRAGTWRGHAGHVRHIQRIEPIGACRTAFLVAAIVALAPPPPPCCPRGQKSAVKSG